MMQQLDANIYGAMHQMQEYEQAQGLDQGQSYGGPEQSGGRCKPWTPPTRAIPSGWMRDPAATAPTGKWSRSREWYILSNRPPRRLCSRAPSESYIPAVHSARHLSEVPSARMLIDALE
eukprot:GHVU01161060.1.p1 GENE.GHVU01161060.1~~GHVU01161060.1.p1  ORF type:complete len:119 (-),score=6.53 GHVU01161060.1:1284-1640(-)